MRVAAMIKKIIIQMLRDKRTLALMFVAPLLILTLMYFLFNSQGTIPSLGVVGIDENLVKLLDESELEVIQYSSADETTITSDNLGGLLKMDSGKLILTLQNNDVSTAKALLMRINGALTQEKILKAGAASNNQLNMSQDTLTVSYLYGNEDTEFFDTLSPILIGFFVFFFVFIISGIGLLREKTTKTLERLVSTPIKRWEIVIGYLIGFGIFATIQTFIIVFFAVKILNLTLMGSIWNVIFINILTAFVALALGILLSTFATSEFQMMQFIPVVVIPQIFFAGIIPVENMASWLQAIGKIMPMYYVGSALEDIMYKGYGLGDILNYIGVLLLFATIFILLNIQALKRYRKL